MRKNLLPHGNTTAVELSKCTNAAVPMTKFTTVKENEEEAKTYSFLGGGWDGVKITCTGQVNTENKNGSIDSKRVNSNPQGGWDNKAYGSGACTPRVIFLHIGQAYMSLMYVSKHHTIHCCVSYFLFSFFSFLTTAIWWQDKTTVACSSLIVSKCTG